MRQYDLKVPYLLMDRSAGRGTARLFVPKDAREPMALIVAMHYELGLDGAAEYLDQGWAVMTPREALNPFGDGVNFNLALLQACRQVPFVDAQRIALFGGSAGGYVTLMVASEAFPIAAATPIAPPVSMPYNVEYFANNVRPAQCGAKDDRGEDASRVPVFCSIAEAITGFAAFLGPLRRTWRVWLRNSPVGVMNLVTCPLLVTFSTADTLVPVNQVSDRLAVQAPKGAFPPRFEFARHALTGVPGARRTFMQAAGRRARTFRLKVPDGLPRLCDLDETGAATTALEMPCVFSRRQPLSVVILDEGPPDPRLGHFKYHFRYSVVSFLDHCFRRKTPAAPAQLTQPKLESLMRRFLGQDFEGLIGSEKPGKPPTSLSRRNRPAREKADVVAGLRAYCESGPAHRRRLKTLYRKLPASLRALDVGAVRFDQDPMGGLVYHEAILHHSSGDRARGLALAQALLGKRAHRAYAACLPGRLLRTARRRVRASRPSGTVRGDGGGS